jgi:hypothetical protein
LKELEKRKLGWLKASVWEEGTTYVGTQKKEAVERTGTHRDGKAGKCSAELRGTSKKDWDLETETRRAAK